MRKFEIKVTKGQEFESLKPYILDYIESNKAPHLFNLEKEYKYFLDYNEEKINQLFYNIIEKEEAELVVEAAYSKIKSRATNSEAYEDFTNSSIDDFLYSERGEEILLLVQSHIITAFSEDEKVNDFGKQLALFLASSYRYFQDTIAEYKLVNPQSEEEVKRIYNHLIAIYVLTEKSGGKGYKYHTNDISELGKTNPDIYDDLKGFTIPIGENKLISDIDRETGVRSFSFYYKDEDLPELYISIPEIYYKAVIFKDIKNFNFNVWFDFVETNKIKYMFSKSYYSRILLEEAFENMDNSVFDGIKSHYYELLATIRFKRDDFLTNTISSYNKYFIGKMYDIISNTYPSYTDHSKYLIISSFLVELGIAKTEKEYSGGQRYNEYLRDFVKNALRTPKY